MTRLVRILPLVLLAVALAAPATAQAKSGGTRVLPGQSAVIWSDPSATADDETAAIVLTASSGVSALAAGTTAGCNYKGVNAFGWTLWSYTLNQYFQYDGVNITYYPAGTYTTEAYWGWYDNGSTAPTKHWITQPRSAYSIGYYAFRRDVQDYHESRNGWVRADIRGTGSWWCSAA